MNTQPTQHPPSAIEVLFDALLLAHEDNEEEIAEAIASIWLPIFRSEHNFAMALDAVKISHESEITADLCNRYLGAIESVK